MAKQVRRGGSASPRKIVRCSVPLGPEVYARLLALSGIRGVTIGQIMSEAIGEATRGIVVLDRRRVKTADQGDLDEEVILDA